MKDNERSFLKRAEDTLTLMMHGLREGSVDRRTLWRMLRDTVALACLYCSLGPER